MACVEQVFCYHDETTRSSCFIASIRQNNKSFAIKKCRFIFRCSKCNNDDSRGKRAEKTRNEMATSRRQFHCSLLGDWLCELVLGLGSMRATEGKSGDKWKKSIVLVDQNEVYRIWGGGLGEVGVHCRGSSEPNGVRFESRACFNCARCGVTPKSMIEVQGATRSPQSYLHNFR